MATRPTPTLSAASRLLMAVTAGVQRRTVLDGQPMPNEFDAMGEAMALIGEYDRERTALSNSIKPGDVP